MVRLRMRSPRDDEIAATLDATDPALAHTHVSTRGRAIPATLDQHAVQNAPAQPAPDVTRESPLRYTTEGELGRGGMGRVVLAFDRHLGRDIAMKMLLGSEDTDGATIGALTRFLREARVTGQLEHPGIVPVHELGQREDGTLYYPMKRIRGRSLAEVLRDRKTLTARLELASVFRDVCEAIAYAHARGAIHRDMKPDNVMVGEFGETLVVDWGLAKTRDEDDPSPGLAPPDPHYAAAQTIDGAAMGTPAYMSPEQARGESKVIDERSDVWGLGAILFEILTGRAPFEGKTGLDILAKVMDEEPPRVRELERDAPRELAAIAERAMNKNRDARYANAGEMAAEIAAWQDGRAVSAYEYSSWELVQRFARKNRAATLATFAVVAAAFVAAGLVYRSYLAEQEQREAAELARDAARASDIESRTALADALVERATRAFDEGDRAAAAVYAAAALRSEPDASAAPQRSELDLLRARDRVARAYSLWHEADRTRIWKYIRRTDADKHCAIVGPRILCPARNGFDAEDIATGAIEHITVEGIDSPEQVRRVDDNRIMLGLSGHQAEAIVDLRSRSIAARIPAASAIAFTRDRAFAQLENGDISVMGTGDFAEIERFASGALPSTNLAASADGRRLALRTRTAALLLEFPRTAPALSIPVGVSPRLFEFSPDGHLLAIPRNVTSVLLVDTSNGSIVREIPTASWSASVTWLDAEHIAIAHDTARIEIRPIDGSSAIEWLRPPSGGSHIIHRAGNVLVDLPDAPPDRRIRGSVYRSVRRSNALAIPSDAPVLTLALDRERHLWIATPTSLRRYDEEGREVRRLALDPDLGLAHSGLVFAPDGALATVTTDGIVFFAERTDNALRMVLPRPTTQYVLLGIAISPDGDTIFVATPRRGEIRRWSRTRGVLEPLVGHESTVLGIAASPDGRTLASASIDGTVRLWHLDDGDRSEIIANQEHLVSDVAFSPDGTRLASADADGWIAIYEGSRQVSRARVHAQWINRIAWWPNGRWIVSASDDGTARVSSIDGRVVDRIVNCASSCLGIAPARSGDALYVPRDTEVVRIPLAPGTGPRDPPALLRRAERRAGVRLEGLDLVPID